MTTLDPHKELVRLARAMRKAEINLIVGIRAICALKWPGKNSPKELIHSLRAVNAETILYPVGDARSKFSEKELQQMDAEMAEFLMGARPSILEACSNIIDAYSELCQK